MSRTYKILDVDVPVVGDVVADHVHVADDDHVNEDSAGF
jgi:hypothetical protein